jgi:hypothetical protein
MYVWCVFGYVNSHVEQMSRRGSKRVGVAVTYPVGTWCRERCARRLTAPPIPPRHLASLVLARAAACLALRDAAFVRHPWWWRTPLCGRTPSLEDDCRKTDVDQIVSLVGHTCRVARTRQLVGARGRGSGSKLAKVGIGAHQREVIVG